MRNLKKTATAVSMLAGAAHAGGVEQMAPSMGILFETGNYIEFTFGSINPSVSGTQVGVLPPSITGSDSGDLAQGLGFVGAALKFAVTDKVDAALIFDQPYAATIAYPIGTGYFAQGSTATLNSNALSAVGRYKFTDNISAYAGVRIQQLNAEATIPFIPGVWSGTTATDTAYGYLAGIAYERPEIALRVALTYHSSITHDLPTTEYSVLGMGNTSTMEVDTPQSLQLDFQTGIAERTLAFGSVRWVDWSEFAITPADYQTITGDSLVAYRDDTFTYTLGVGRQLNENWAISGFAVYEPSTGGFRSNLFPPDGRKALGVGVTYTQDSFKLQAGLQHIWLGDAMTQAFGAPAGEFKDNTAVAFGLKAGFSF